MYRINMIKTVVIGALITTTSALAVPAYACGFHGGGFGGFGNANWKPYNPRVSTEDPAFLNKDTSQASLTLRPIEDTRPSFSNAANRAALIAKARVAKKAKNRDNKTAKEAVIQKVSLDSDR